MDAHNDRDRIATSPTPEDDVVVLAGSTRTGSWNEQLAHLLVRALRDRAIPTRFVDLRDHPMPLLDPDTLLRDGPPPAAHELHATLAAARAVVIVSPEYNGAMTPLLKNSVDWVSRVDIATFFTKRVVLAAATPGRGGAANGLALTATWLRSIGADVHTETFGLASVRHVFVDGVLADDEAGRFAAFVDGVAAWLTAPLPGTDDADADDRPDAR